MPHASVTQRVRAEYDALAPRYEQRWGPYVRASADATLGRLRLRPGDRVLDVGCGTGVLLQRIQHAQPGVRLAGVDLAPGMLAQARARLPNEVALLAADAEALPFPAGSFDAVGSASSFHYWPSPRRGLEELRRVLRPDGQLVLTDWCDDYLPAGSATASCGVVKPAHRRIYGRTECGELLAAARYRVVQVDRYRISWLWGLMTAIARTPAG